MTLIVMLIAQVQNTKIGSSKYIIKSNAKKWLDLILDVNFMALTVLNLISFPFSLNLLKTWGHHFFVENHQFNVILLYFKQNFHELLVWHPRLRLLEYVNLFWDCFCQNKLLGFVDQFI